MSTAMSETTPDAAGASSGLLSTSQQVGAAIGLAALSSIAVAATNHLSAHGQATAAATVAGYHLSWAIGAAVLTAAAAIAAMTLTGRRPGTGHQPVAAPADAATAPVEGPESVRA
jgi:hypothetical protein